MFSSLIRLKAPELVPSQAGGQKATEVITYLSDWHLLAFIPTTGLFGDVRFDSLTRRRRLKFTFYVG